MIYLHFFYNYSSNFRTKLGLQIDGPILVTILYSLAAIDFLISNKKT